MAADGDNLDARMEAIRLKNEELEKKHAEIMEDEEKAKRDNAIVDVNSQKNLPKDHPYDHIELDFDVKDTDKELAVNPDYKPKNRRPPPRQDLLDEIPPDPVNFLREDSDDKPRPESSQNQRPPNNRNRNNNNINRNRSDRPRPERGNSNEFDASIGDSPPGPRQQNQRPRPPQQARSPQDGNSPKKAHPQQLRTERRSVPVSSDEQPGQFQQQPNRQRRPNNRSPNKEAGDRNNITVQITDGEVRSVKLKSSEKTFGTGRVGHARNENVQKFTVDTFDPENAGERSQQDRSPQEKPRNRNPRNNRRNQKPREFQHPTLENIIITKTSVQDRLLKIAKDDVKVEAVDASNGE